MLVMSDHLNRMLRDHTLHVCAGQVAASDEAARIYSKIQGPGMKPRTGSTKIKIAETVGIIHLYPHMKVSQSFGDFFPCF